MSGQQNKNKNYHSGCGKRGPFWPSLFAFIFIPSCVKRICCGVDQPRLDLFDECCRLWKVMLDFALWKVFSGASPAPGGVPGYSQRRRDSKGRGSLSDLWGVVVFLVRIRCSSFERFLTIWRFQFDFFRCPRAMNGFVRYNPYFCPLVLFDFPKFYHSSHFDY